MIGLILAIIVAIVTVALAGLQLFAAGMSDNPQAAGEVSVWPTLVVGLGIAGFLAFTHFHHFGW